MTHPSLSQIAILAGVSPMTVSRALSGRGRIAETTRKRIVSLSKKHGYRPDPEINKLMHHLRGRRRRRFQSLIVGLTTRPAEDPEPYFRAVMEGARAQLANCGYGFELMPIARTPAGWGGVQRTLISRGVEGLLILPQHAATDLTRLLDWSRFSAVSTSASALVPGTHRVMPHHFANALLLCRELARRKHRRIGLVITADYDRRTDHGFTAGLTWHGLNEAGHLVKPLLLSGSNPASLRAWFAAERPDVIVTNEGSAARAYAAQLGNKIARSVSFAVTSRLSEPCPFPGIDEQPGRIGAAAADLLASRVERRIRSDTTAIAATTLLAGRWVD